MMRHLPVLRLCTGALLALGLAGCFPDEGDVARRANAINMAAAERNAGTSLVQAANNHLAWIKAENLRRKVVMEPVFTSFVSAIPQGKNPQPPPPAGVGVAICGNIKGVMGGGGAPAGPVGYGAIAYFTAQPKGLPALKYSGETIAATVAERLGPDAVGFQSPSGGTTLPKKALEISPGGTDCAVGGDIMPGSPIVAIGFSYIDAVLPDQGKSINPKFTRDITVPCPAPLTGVIKREQVCDLKSDDDETKREEATVKIGELTKGLVENSVKRLDKKWDCTPAIDAPPAPATAAEEAIFCHDPAMDLTKPADNVANLQTKNMQQRLEMGNSTGVYDYKCQSDGAGGCLNTGGGIGPGGNGGTGSLCPDGSAPPCAACEVKCVPDNMPAQFIMNPLQPMTLDESGKLSGDPFLIQDCGNQWRGKLIARYELRRCQLQRICGATVTPLGVRQNIWHLAYAGALCETDVSYRTACPIGDRTKTLPITRHLKMLKPVALDWHPPAIAGSQNTPSEIATNDSNPLIHSDAAAQGFVVPNLTQADLNNVANDQSQWSLAVARGMRARDPSSISMAVTACDETGAPCGSAPNANSIDIIVDDSSGHPLRDVQGARYVFPKLICDGAGTCNSLLEEKQETCQGICTQDFSTDIIVEGTNFIEVLDEFINKVANYSLPPGVSINYQKVQNSLPFFNEPSSICLLASNPAKRAIMFAAYDGTVDPLNNAQCAYLPNNPYNSSYIMSNDAVDKYKQGNELVLYSRLVKGGGSVGASDSISGDGDVTINLLQPNGAIAGKLREWLANQLPAQPLSPCSVIQ